MKTIITSQKESIKVTKKQIKEILELERGLSYYSHLQDDTIAHAIGITQHQFLNGEGTKTQVVNAIYESIEELVEQYIAYQDYLQESN
jgi:hypothetical protein